MLANDRINQIKSIKDPFNQARAITCWNQDLNSNEPLIFKCIMKFSECEDLTTSVNSICDSCLNNLAMYTDGAADGAGRLQSKAIN